MARAHELLPQTAELVMVDAAGGLDRQLHRLYLLVTPTAAGGVPIGAIIADSEKEEVFSTALEALITCFPQQKAFFGHQGPQIFLTDNDLKERQGLQRLFPSSKMLLCQFHVLKAVWAWLCDPKHGISKDDRQEIYMTFKSVLYAVDEPKLNSRYDQLTGLTALEDSTQCSSYFDKLWCSRWDWATAFRTSLPLRGSNTTDYIEVAFRILKDCVFDRVMAFSLCQLVDFIVTRYEAYMEKRLLDFCNGRYCKALLRNMMPAPADIPDSCISLIESGLYSVISPTSGSTYTVDLQKGFCTCYIGASGKLCKHASAVLLQADIEITSRYNIVSADAKLSLFKVATGQSPPKDWFAPLTASADNLVHIRMPDGTENSNDSTGRDACESSDNHVNAGTSADSHTTASEELLSRFENFVSRIKQGLLESPETFTPALDQMMSNIDKFASTETGLLSAMHTVGKYSGLEPVVHQRRLNSSTAGFRRHGIQIGVQPTAVGRRRHTLTGKRKLTAGRPCGTVLARQSIALQTHDCTTFGTMPSHKRKAPHNLQRCVYSNIGLGGTKHAKQ